MSGLPDLRVLLIGLPGGGKSALAAPLAERHGLAHLSIDDFRRRYSDGTAAGDDLARSHFLRALGTETGGVFEFSAAGKRRHDAASALRERHGPLLTVWVDAPRPIRERRLAARGGHVSWPVHQHELSGAELDEVGARVLRDDHAQGFWSRDLGWEARRIDTSGSLDAVIAELFRLVDDFIARRHDQ
jgi:predicted kinase